MRTNPGLTTCFFLAAGAWFSMSCAQSTAPTTDTRQPTDRSSAPLVHGLSDEAAHLGNLFLPLARRFGLSNFAHASPGARGGALYEYLPPGETLDAWTRIGTLYIFRVGETWEDAEATLPRYVEALRKGAPEVHSTDSFPGAKGGSFFIHYTTGGGPIREEGLSAIWAVFPGHLANFQTMKRGEPYSEQDIEYFRSIAASLTTPRKP